MLFEEFEKKFEKTLEKNAFTWDSIKQLITKYPEEFEVYALQHKKRLVIREITKCDGCKWNDGLPHSACYNCD